MPEVSTVERHGHDVVVYGDGDLVTAIVLALDRAGLRAEDIRPEESSLEDAFLALTDESARDTTRREIER